MPPPTPAPDDLLFAFVEGRLLIREVDGVPSLPAADLAPRLFQSDASLIHVATVNGRAAWAAAVDPAAELGSDLTAVGLRSLFGRLPDPLMAAAGRSSQLVDWYLGHAFCGRCGTATELSPSETARVCPSCGALHFPRVTPAVIMVVEDGDRLLLAHSKRFATAFYSALAGFVEPGETLEQAVEREVAEEVGLEIENIRYFGSQSWPFPSQLMIGFFASYRSGEIRLQEEEITDARWFSVGDLPNLPGPPSIARRLIEDFLSRHPA